MNWQFLFLSIYLLNAFFFTPTVRPYIAIAQLVEQWSRNPAIAVRNQGDAIVSFGKALNPHYQVSRKWPKAVGPLVAY